MVKKGNLKMVRKWMVTNGIVGFTVDLSEHGWGCNCINSHSGECAHIIETRTAVARGEGEFTYLELPDERGKLEAFACIEIGILPSGIKTLLHLQKKGKWRREGRSVSDELGTLIIANSILVTNPLQKEGEKKKKASKW